MSNKIIKKKIKDFKVLQCTKIKDLKINVLTNSRAEIDFKFSITGENENTWTLSFYAYDIKDFFTLIVELSDYNLIYEYQFKRKSYLELKSIINDNMGYSV